MRPQERTTFIGLWKNVDRKNPQRPNGFSVDAWPGAIQDVDRGEKPAKFMPSLAPQLALASQSVRVSRRLTGLVIARLQKNRNVRFGSAGFSDF
jgi:hypothetical protein